MMHSDHTNEEPAATLAPDAASEQPRNVRRGRLARFMHWLSAPVRYFRKPTPHTPEPMWLSFHNGSRDHSRSDLSLHSDDRQEIAQQLIQTLVGKARGRRTNLYLDHDGTLAPHTWCPSSRKGWLPLMAEGASMTPREQDVLNSSVTREQIRACFFDFDFLRDVVEACQHHGVRLYVLTHQHARLVRSLHEKAGTFEGTAYASLESTIVGRDQLSHYHNSKLFYAMWTQQNHDHCSLFIEDSLQASGALTGVGLEIQERQKHRNALLDQNNIIDAIDLRYWGSDLATTFEQSLCSGSPWGFRPNSPEVRLWLEKNQNFLLDPPTRLVLPSLLPVAHAQEATEGPRPRGFKPWFR